MHDTPIPCRFRREADENPASNEVSYTTAAARHIRTNPRAIPQFAADAAASVAPVCLAGRGASL
jgi:hypothetical protein